MFIAPLLDALIRQALAEDLAGGDLTSDALFPRHSFVVGEAVAKSDLVVSGVDPFVRTFFLVAPGCRVEPLVEDGASVSAGTVLFRVEGETRGMLAAERTALNFLQQLSGTATLTRAFVDRAADRCRIVDTRKTIPGLRALQRAAVRHGGGSNHRDSLGSAVLIKDNHIAAAGGVKIAVERARAHAPHTTRIEIEVTDFDELDEALAASADIVMLDNFDDRQIREAVTRVAGRALVEVSGGITLDRVEVLAASGVDVISVGALTHSAPAADISLRLRAASADAPTLGGRP